MALIGQSLQHRKDKGGGFAGPGLGSRQEVVARKDFGDGLRLNRRGPSVALRCDCSQQIGP
jgi:hypothetical protein